MTQAKTKVNDLTETSSTKNEGNFRFMAQVIGVPSETSTAITLKNTSTGEVLEVQPPNKFFSIKGFYGKATISKNGGSTTLVSFVTTTEQNLELPLGKVVSYRKDTKCTWIWTDISSRPSCINSNLIEASIFTDLTKLTAYGDPNTQTIYKIR